MANPLQQAAVRRKVIYLGVIIGLFTVSLFWRGKIPVPLSTRNATAAKAQAATILGQADRLELRELDQGDANLGTSVAQVSMVGLRGPVTTILWKTTIEKQKRGEYHEFEQLSRLVTLLQPHFIDPWLFQSWNTSYNVSVENDKLGDTFYYIARGIELLAEGDRINSKSYRAPDGVVYALGSPELRHEAGFFYQNKFGVSDKVSTLRSLMQLACIPPAERDPRTFKRDGRIDPDKFRKFCEKNPQLVRRLRAKLNCDRPEEVVQFLEDNVKIPTRYKPDGTLAADIDQFPILPPQYREAEQDEYHPLSPTDDTFDAFHAARAWFGYAIRVIPPPKKDANGEVIPWTAPTLTVEDRYKYRMPRKPAYIIFRQSAPRAQTYLAERLDKEGWFDDKSGWSPDARANPNNLWFKRSPVDPDVTLTTPASSKIEWQRAFAMWKAHGELNGLLLSDTRRANLQSLARRVPADAGYQDLTDPQLAALGLSRDEFTAKKALTFYDQNRQITNFAYFYAAANAEQNDRTVEARKLLWRAEEERQNAENAAAVRDYVAALAAWREVLTAHPDFHHPGRDERAGQSDRTEEETYEFEVNLIRLLKEEPSTVLRAKQTVAATQVLFPGLADVIDADVLQTLAEDEAVARVAALDPRVKQRAAVVAEQKATAALPGAHAATFALVGSAGGSVDQKRTDAILAALKAGLRAGVRPEAEREVLNKDFDWLKAYTSEARDIPWVSEGTKQTVRTRLGLVRQKAPPPEATPPPQPGG